MHDNESVQIIAAQTLRQQMAGPDPVTLIDVLPPEHFDQGHLPGAENACVFEVVFIDAVSSLQPDQAAVIVVYGFSGETREAPVAAEKLRRAGYSAVRVLDGGIAAWSAAGFPLERTSTAAAAIWVPALPPPDGRYTVSAGESTIGWTGRNPNGKHFGTVDLASGEVTITNGRFSGDFEIDMATIVSTDLAGDPYHQVLIDHLLSDDFFFVKRFPAVRFELTQMVPLDTGRFGAPNYTVTGTLDMVGVKKTLGFPAVAVPRTDGAVVVSANFDIDRTRWGVVYGADRFFAHLGKHLVFDTISIELRLVAWPAG